MNSMAGRPGLFSPREAHRFLFSQAMEICDDTAIIIDLEGRITYANPATEKLLGCGRQEVAGQFLWDQLTDLDQIGDILETTLHYGQWGGEVVWRTREGAAVPARLRTVLVQTKEGEILGIVGIGWSLASQREMEAQLVRIERQRLLGEMASGVAHNFNNVLIGILGYAQLLDEHEGLPPDARQMARILRSSAETASQLVRRIQMSARGGPQAAPEPVDLNEAVEECVEASRPKWKNQAESEGRTVEVETDLTATRPVDGRASEVGEVLTNLVFNAVDAMPDGGRIRVRTWDEGERVCLSLADTGVGMEREALRRLGELFFTTKGEQGQGLGLAVCYRIVEGMSGRIDVQSVPGRGTTFTLRFPPGTAAAVPDRPSPELERGPIPRRILVIEDDEQIQDFLESALSECDVDLAGNGETGVSLFREGLHDAILVDLSMPGMSGVDVAHQVRAIHPEARIVLMTGWDAPPEGTEDLFDAILRKPFTVSELKRCLREVQS